MINPDERLRSLVTMLRVMTASLAVQTEAPSTFARGWYLICWSRDLDPASVKPLRYMARDFVLYRGESGQARLLDGHCPHLGAHLGHGGCVRGEEIECPFHAWRFAASGKCSAIPYAKRIPPKAKLRSYPVREHSGMILAYFGPEGGESEYEIPEVEELSTPGWTPMEVSEIPIRTQPREVIENVADRAHFRPVHNQRVNEFKMTIEGHKATQKIWGPGMNLKGEKIEVESTAIYHGPAIQFTRLAWAYPMVLINAHVPIDEENLVLRFGVTLFAGEGVDLPQQVIDMHVAAARDGYHQDVAIWENKKWRDKPLLADGDGPIGELRRWYSEFYHGGLA